MQTSDSFGPELSLWICAPSVSNRFILVMASYESQATVNPDSLLGDLQLEAILVHFVLLLCIEKHNLHNVALLFIHLCIASEPRSGF